MMRAILGGLLVIGMVSTATADERLKGIACRSVHLGYPAPEAVAFYLEMKVEQSAEGTYFMACGWSKGYFGIQELGNKKKVVIFSVWDPGEQNDPNGVDKSKRVELLHQGQGVRVGRFGNEGTGGQSFFDYDWKVGETYRFCVTAEKKSDERTAYAGYFWLPEKKEWKHLVTFSTITQGQELRGLYSFVEDFKRDRKSTQKTRRASYNNGWVLTRDGKTVPLDKARFTADANPVLNIDAGVKDGQYYLATGGDITNTGTKLREMVIHPMPAKELPPEARERLGIKK